MDPSRDNSQALFHEELTTRDIVDEAFARARVAWRGPGAWIAGAAVLAAVAFGAVAGILLRRDLIASGGHGAHPRTLLALSAGCLVVALLQTVVALWVVSVLYRAWRGPLDAPADGRRTVMRGAVLCPCLAVLGFGPHLILFGEELVAGTVCLLPGQWTFGWLPVVRYALTVICWLTLVPYLRFATAAMVAEDLGPFRALARSVALVGRAGARVHVLQAFNALLVFVLGCGLATIVTVVVPDADLTHLGEQMDRLPIGPRGFTALTVSLLVVETTWTPHFETGYLLSYLDVRVRTEGLDVERDARHAGLVRREGTA